MQLVSQRAMGMNGAAGLRRTSSRTACAPTCCASPGSATPKGSRSRQQRQGSEACRSQAVDSVTPAQQLQHMQQQQQQLEQAPAPAPVPLKYVVKEAVRRWFTDAHQDAMRGDVKQMALLGQMYAEGYGCEKDQAASKEWIEKSWARGYRMMGVYCEL